MINDPRMRSWALGMSWKSFPRGEPSGLAIRPNGARPAGEMSLSSGLIIINNDWVASSECTAENLRVLYVAKNDARRRCVNP